jgi:hypothetical protein
MHRFSWEASTTVQWIDVRTVAFTGALTWEGFRYARSGPVCDVVDDKGVHYMMSLTDFSTKIPTMVKGRFTGKFEVRKRGTAFLLSLIE